MTEKSPASDPARFREAYILGSRDPWLLWRLQALRAGYVPPLVHGQIPKELSRVTFGSAKKEYEIEPLIEHAKRLHGNHKSILSRLLTWMVVLVMVFGMMYICFNLQENARFRIQLLNALLPRNEEIVPIMVK